MTMTIFLVWTFFVAWVAFSIGYAKYTAQINTLRKENQKLRRAYFGEAVITDGIRNAR